MKRWLDLFSQDSDCGGNTVRTINLKTGMPTVPEALQHLERELARARQAGCAVLKLIHGYGSSGTGGEIRACIFGEDWARSDEQAWALIKARPELKQDTDLGKRNLGITIVVL